MGNTIFKGGEMTININAPEIRELHPRILVLGVGGAGGNAINGMIEAGLQGVEFIAVNTDAQDLKMNKAKAKIQIGTNLTKGLGAGARLDIGQAAADESLNDIINFLQGANMVFITAGMGGGTGTGAAHVIARAAKELNILTVGVITLPFLYEGPSRMRRANHGLEELRKQVDTIVVVPNQNLFKVANENTTLEESFELSNNVLKHGVQSITDLMVKPGLINLDFADVENIMKSMGKAMMGTGEAEGEKRALQSAELALNNPLIDEYSLKGAKGLLVNITGGKDLKLFEVEEAVNKVRAEVDSEAEVIIGSITDSSLEGKMRVSIVATSLDGISPEEKSVVVWFTGLSGSGKSTIAHSLEEELHQKCYRAYVLDGDNIRFGLSSDLDFSDVDRQENIRRIGEVSKLIMDAGLITITAFISPFKIDRDRVREMFSDGDFIEIYCYASLETCESRDVKGLYKLARAGKIKNYTGINSPYDIPENPELILNTEDNTIKESVGKLIGFLKFRRIIK
mgnify:CR=1 FL=1